MPGIRISAIRHAISGSWPDFRKSSADANEVTANPDGFQQPLQRDPDQFVIIDNSD